MAVDIPDTMSEDDVVSALTTSIADNLGVDKSSVTITIDPESGEATFIVTTIDFEEIANALEQIQDSRFADDIISDTGITISEITSNDEIETVVNVAVNADKIAVPLQQAENIVDVGASRRRVHFGY